MSATYDQIRTELGKAVKTAPMPPAPADWKQSAWVLSNDGSMREISAPLVTVRLFEVWTKVLQQRFNGWDGESFHVRVMFDHTKTSAEIASYLNDQFRSILAKKMAEIETKP